MASPLFSILVPTHDHGELIDFQLRSILAQTLPNFEVLVVGDGISEEGRSCVTKHRLQDSRIKFFDFPKAQRHGEELRHRVLRSEARGRWVCYGSDDDLFFPDHLEYMATLLPTYDFVHPLPVFVTLAGEVGIAAGNLGIDAVRQRLLSRSDYNFIGLNGTCHTMELYRRLPHGWRTAPQGIPTDLYMWQQVLSVPGCRPYSALRLTTLHFPDKGRSASSKAERRSELAGWLGKLLTAGGSDKVRAHALATMSMTNTWNAERTLALEHERDVLRQKVAVIEELRSLLGLCDAQPISADGGCQAGISGSRAANGGRASSRGERIAFDVGQLIPKAGSS